MANRDNRLRAVDVRAYDRFGQERMALAKIFGGPAIYRKWICILTIFQLDDFGLYGLHTQIFRPWCFHVVKVKYSALLRSGARDKTLLNESVQFPQFMICAGLTSSHLYRYGIECPGR